MSKKVFNLNTTNHYNASYNQAEEVRAWLVAVMEEVANNTAPEGHSEGHNVTVIVEVLND